MRQTTIPGQGEIVQEHSGRTETTRLPQRERPKLEDVAATTLGAWSLRFEKTSGRPMGSPNRLGCGRANIKVVASCGHRAFAVTPGGLEQFAQAWLRMTNLMSVAERNN